MKNITTIVVASLMIVGLALTPRLNADDWNKLTKLTFSAPVEIPGQVLPAGTYVFKLLDSQSNRNIVQIYDADQKKLFANILAIPDYRLKLTDKTVIKFEERAGNSPEAIQAWFYPGDNYGQQFVYPKERAVELAKTNNQPVPSMPSSLVANTQQPTAAPTAPTAPHIVALKQAPVKAQQAAGEEVEVTEVFVTPPVLLAQVDQSLQPSRPAELPTTASPLASIALSGLMIGCLGLILRFAARKVS
jgi:hypothetical protein